jgi:hypothetical protein
MQSSPAAASSAGSKPPPARPHADQVRLHQAVHAGGTSVSHYGPVVAERYVRDRARLAWALRQLRRDLKLQAAWRGATDVIGLMLSFDPFAAQTARRARSCCAEPHGS